MLPDFEREEPESTGLLDRLTIPEEIKRHFHPDTLKLLSASQPQPQFALALDLEGTLIDDVYDLTVRPGLAHFLDCCQYCFDHVVINLRARRLLPKSSIWWKMRASLQFPMPCFSEQYL